MVSKVYPAYFSVKLPVIRVLHILWSAHFGGIEKLVHDLALTQSSNEGMQVAILFGTAHGEFFRKFQDAGLECHVADLSHGADLSPWKLARAYRILKSFDVLHVHTFVVPLALVVALSGRHVVYTEHGNFGFGRKRLWADRIKRPLYRLFLRHWVDHLTFNSDWTRQVWEQRCGRTELRRSVVSNGISFEAANGTSHRSCTGLEPVLRDAFVVGTTSRFAGFKRIDRLIRAFGRFQKGRNTRLVLVGDGMLRPDLEALARDLGILDRTVFTGFRSDVCSCQGLMDVCVFPSQNEPFGLVAVETLALGKPTIVFADGGGIVDIVCPVCVEDVVENEDQLVERLSYYYENPEQIESTRVQRAEHAKTHDLKGTAASYKKLYQSLMSPSAIQSQRG